MPSSNGDPLSKPLNICLIAAISCLLWGSAAPVIKIGYGLLNISESQPAAMILFAGCRFTIAGLLVLAFASLKNKRLCLLQGSGWSDAIKLGLFQTVFQYILFYIGVANASGVHSAILTGASNLWAILLACYLFRQEKMNAAKLAGCILGFGGILLMNMTGEGGGVTLTGEGFVLLSGISSGVASGLAKIYSQREHPVTLTGWQFLLGGVVMVICALLAGGRMAVNSLAAAGVLLYLGFLSAVAYSLWTVLIQHNNVSQVSVFGFMTPMFGVVLSALLLGETGQAFSWNALVALAMVCGGIVAVNRFGSTKIHK